MHEIRVSFGNYEKQREMMSCLLPRLILRNNSSKTTEIYTHITASAKGKIKSPLDNLELNDDKKRK